MKIMVNPRLELVKIVVITEGLFLFQKSAFHGKKLLKRDLHLLLMKYQANECGLLRSTWHSEVRTGGTK